MEQYNHRRIKSFVLRTGRTSSLQKRAIEKYSDKYCIKYEEKIIDLERVFGNGNEVFLEIGFGMGHATVEIAVKNPGKNYIGVEVHTPGIGRVLNETETRNLKNLRVIRHDAVEVVENMISDDSLSGINIFFPDPWPKKKHFKRRLIQKEFISILLPKLKPGGYIYVATDWEPYAQWILDVMDSFTEIENKYSPFAENIDWRPLTSFELKGLSKKHTIRNIWFEKKLY